MESVHPTKILILGTGGVGIIQALNLNENCENCEVTCIVRSNYEKALSEGYHIDSANYGEFRNWKPKHIVRDVESSKEFGPFDYILVSTKNIPDGPSPVHVILEGCVTPRVSKIILLQNGIDIEKEVHESYPYNIILSGVTLIGSSNINCQVVQTGFETVSLGCFFNNENFTDDEQVLAAEKYISIYSNEKNKITYDDNVRLTRWKKLVYNAAVNTCTALANMDVSRCTLANSKPTIMVPAMKEIYKIAKSEGFEIPENVLPLMLGISDGLFYKPSMLIDVQKNQLMELEVILGNPIRILESNGVEVPVLKTLYSLLFMIQFRIKENNGLINVDSTVQSVSMEAYGSGF